MPEPDGPTGEELRERYGDQVQSADIPMVISLLGRNDIDPDQVWAARYATLEAFKAFADGNWRHHGHTTLGPVADSDGAFYGLVILNLAVNRGDAVLADSG